MYTNESEYTCSTYIVKGVTMYVNESEQKQRGDYTCYALTYTYIVGRPIGSSYYEFGMVALQFVQLELIT